MSDTPYLIVHRSADELGGNCIEIGDGNGRRLILDVGIPVETPDSERKKIGLPTTLDTTKPVDGLLISHAHQDHYELLDEIPERWPIHCGKATGELIRFTRDYQARGHSRSKHKPIAVERFAAPWKDRTPFAVGSLIVTPFSTDHSAFGASMLLIEVGGKRILYSGDFRRHGRQSHRVDEMLEHLEDTTIDVLILEGTNIERESTAVSEQALEDRFVEMLGDARGRVFVFYSSQNIERFLTIFNACRRSGWQFVIDLYTAEILDMLASPENGLPVPCPKYGRHLRVMWTKAQVRKNIISGREDFNARMLNPSVGTKPAFMNAPRCPSVILTRESLIDEFASADIVPTPRDIWCWSMWKDYIDRSPQAKKWFTDHHCRYEYMHTGGHAPASDLQAFAERIKASIVIPVHGDNLDAMREKLPNVRRLVNGARLELT